MQVFFLIYIFLGLIMGAAWARSTLKEYPESEDGYELNFIRLYQSWYAFAGIAFLLLWYDFVSQEIRFQEAFLFLFLGWFFVFLYDLRIERPEGLMSGPGVPFLNKSQMDAVRTVLSRY